jgi:tRNA(Ile)-lysidine synthase
VPSLPLIVGTAIRRHRLLPDGAGCVVGVSGGLDSVVLLDLLRRQAARYGWTLHVAHFNHRLRGRASDADERFVRELAREFGLPITCDAGDVRGHAGTRRCPVEVAARELRHAFLARVARATGFFRVALAHHANDQTETFFIRLLRGAGGEGLAGMRFESPSPADPAVLLVRPLLDVTRAELEAHARAAGLRWREDASNREERPLRNWLRRRVVPLLEQRTRGALHRLVNRAAQIVAAEAHFSREEADRWLSRGARRPRFDRLAVAVQRQVIARQLTELGVEARFEWIEALRLDTAVPVTTCAGLIWRDPEGRLHRGRTEGSAFQTAEGTLDLRAPAGRVDFAGLRGAWRCFSVSPGWKVPPPVLGREFLDAARLGRRVVLRHWRRGDRFQPLGLPTPAKLQDLFTNAKVPRDARHAAVLLANTAGEIVWVERLRLGEAAKVRPSTRRVFEWRWERPEA